MSAAHANAFYREVASTRRVWTLRDAGGFPAPLAGTGVRAQPFWSSLTRVERVIARVAAYRGFQPVEIPWLEFRDRWLPELRRDRMLVGVNWAGSKATGYDLPPETVRDAIEWQIAHLAPAV